MRTKKRVKSNEKPKETGTWYKSLIEGKNKAEYYRHFTSKLNSIIVEYFGEKEAVRVLKAVQSGKIQIPSIESFLFDFEDINDSSLTLYNTCKTVDEFVAKSIIALKKRAETGETDIPVIYFFLALADILQTNELCSVSFIQETLKNFIMSLITVKDKNPYQLTLIEPKWAREIGEKLGLNMKKYSDVFSRTLLIIDNIMDQVRDIRAYLPNIQFIYPVYHSARENQIQYLISRFHLMDRPTVVTKLLQNIPDLAKDTPQLRSALEYLQEKSNRPFLSIDGIILELMELRDSTFFKRYPTKRELKSILNKDTVPNNYYNKFDIHPTFADKILFEQCLVPYFCEVRIDCSKIKKENIESFIDAAKIINLTKGYHNKTKRDIDNLTFKITLLNVQEATKEFYDFIENKLERIKSSTNKNFIIEVYYDRDIITSKIPEEVTTHFRIISDIHADYNEGHNYQFNFGNDYIINCGDTAGSSIVAGHWIKNYMKQGVFVVGNHLGYSSSHPERDGMQNMELYSHYRHPSSTKREQIKELYNLTTDPNIVLLSNTCIEHNGIIIIGTCLYTDFDLYGKEHREECMAYAKKGMNDFRLPVVMDNHYYTQDKNGVWWPNTKKKEKVRPFDVSDHAFYFQYSFGFIRQKVEEFKHKPIIVVTHHAPTPYAIEEKYTGSLLNAAFASNLNKFIIEHPQIRLWCFGHVHSPHDFILGETRMVCCPFGYNNENNFNLPYEYGLRIPIEEIKSKKSWRKIFCKEIATGRMECYDE